MAYTETTYTGYGTRVKNSFKAIGTGFMLFLAGTALLWWNEGRAVKTNDMLNEAEAATVVMENPNKLDNSLEGELVCATALATTEDSLIDQQFGFGAKAIAIKRTVRYYQVQEKSKQEKKDKIGGGEETVTTYTYNRGWVTTPINSEGFHDPGYRKINFVLTTVPQEDVWAQNVTFGAYTLPESLIRSITSTEPLKPVIAQERLESMNEDARHAALRNYSSSKLGNVAKSHNAEVGQFIHVTGNELYFGMTPSSPAVGDVKVTFEKVVPAKVTLIAKVNGNTFEPYKAKNGYTFQTLVMGEKDATEIYEGEHDMNNIMLWVFRIIGILMVIGGLKGIFGFLETLLKVLPFIANILGWGVGVICTVVGVVWSLIVIAIAWLFYRPLLGITLLVVAGLLIWIFAFKGKDKLKELAVKSKKKEIVTA
jgi:hypothetical protein